MAVSPRCTWQLAYLIGMVIFLVVLDYPGITDPAQKVALIVDKQMVIFSTNLLMYVFFGVFLIVLSLALYDRLKSGAPAHHAGGNRDRDHLGWLADRQRHGRECRDSLRSSRSMPKTRPRLR